MIGRLRFAGLSTLRRGSKSVELGTGRVEQAVRWRWQAVHPSGQGLDHLLFRPQGRQAGARTALRFKKKCISAIQNTGSASARI